MKDNKNLIKQKRWMEGRLTEKQAEVIRYDNRRMPRLTILEGAARSGKTRLNNYLWLAHVSRFRGRGLKFLMTGHTLSSLKRNVLDGLAEMFEADIQLNAHHEFSLLGNTMVCMGADTADRCKALKGFTVHGWYANEVTEQHENSVRQALIRCSGEGARAFWDTNPSYPSHYIKRDFIDRDGETASDGRVAVKSWHFRLEDNPTLDPFYVESLKQSLPRQSAWYARDIEGEWAAAGRAIYNHYSTADVPDGEVARGFDTLTAGLDFGRGGASPYAFLLIGRRGNEFTVLREVYRAGLTNGEFIRLTESAMSAFDGLKENIVVYTDSADPDKTREWQMAGWRAVPAAKGAGSVLAGIEAVLRVELRIDKRCVMTLNEIEGYEWNSDDDLTPVKFRDHCMDALRYCVRMSERVDGEGGMILRA